MDPLSVSVAYVVKFVFGDSGPDRIGILLT